MWCQTVFVFMVITCVENLETKPSLSTMELMKLAQCEARCYLIEEDEDGSTFQRANATQEMDKKAKKNGSEDCIKSCLLHRELHNSSVRRSVTKGLGPSAPQLHCREATVLSVEWECSGKPVFVVEFRSEDNEWSPLDKTLKKMATLRNTTSDTKYQFRVTAILPDGRFGNASASEWISTLNSTFKPGPVSGIRATNAILRPGGSQLQTTISWEPAWDRTCFYEAVCFSDTTSLPVPIYIKEPEKFERVFDTLAFGKKYNITIMGKSADGRRESDKSWFFFSTPVCLAYYQNDLTKCVPPKPSNVSVQEEEHNMSQLYDVTVSWETPALLPSYHKVELFRILPEDDSTLAHKNVSGNSTWVTFTALDLGVQYEVTVQAVSPAGPSERAKVIRTVTGHPERITTSYSNSPTWDAEMMSFILPPVVLLAAASGVCMYVCHRRDKKMRHERRCQYNETLDQKQSLRTEDYSSVECDVDFDAKWEIPRENLVLGDVLGEGAFGVVRKGVLQEGGNWRDVAVKMLREKPSTEEVRQFRQEINMMQSVGRHPNIVSLIGCCTSGGLLRLVVEYCAQGDLLNFLRKNWNEMANITQKESAAIVTQSQKVKYAELLMQETTGDGESVYRSPGAVVNQAYGIVTAGDSSEQLRKQLSPEDLLSFARQTAIGMEYLANNRVVHRDLAARNVLVCADRTVKISDFGLSRDIYEENVYRKKGSGRLPIRWMAPESLLRQVYNTHSDVWSFGVLLWEIVTLGGNPYPGISTNKLPRLLREGHRMECPANCSKELYKIMFSCWKAEPRYRPTFAELHEMLDVLLENSSPQKYLNLNLINYKSEQQNKQHSRFRNNGSSYLISNKNPTFGSEDCIPASPFIEDGKHHYLNMPLKSKHIETTSTVDEENKKD